MMEKTRINESMWNFVGYAKDEQTPWSGKVTFNSHVSQNILSF